MTKKVSNSKPVISDKHLALLNQVLSFRSRLAGVQYGGKRDIYAAAGYPSQKGVTFEEYWGIYTRDGIGGRIVDMPARTTWRTPPEIAEDGHDKGTQFTDAFETLAKRLKLWHYFGRADRLAGVARYAVLFIGTKGADDSQLKLPLLKVENPDDILYLGIYSERNAEISEWETDPSNQNFGQPRLYKLKTTTDSQAFKARSTDLIVHSSRCIHIAEDKLEDDVFGRPRLERVLNRLFDLDKVAASTGESYWQLVNQILQAKVDPAAEIDATAIDQLDEKLGEMLHDLRRQFTGKGVDLSWLSTQTPNVQQVADFYFSLIAGSAGIPKRILFGSELGELASSQDQENYLGMINERQEQFAEPEILRQFIDRLIGWGALPKPTSGDYQVNWPILFEASDTEKADVSLKRSQAAAALTPIGGNPRELIRISADSEVQLIEREPDEPIDMLLPADANSPSNNPPPPQPPLDPNAPNPNDPNAQPGATQQPPNGGGKGAA